MSDADYVGYESVPAQEYMRPDMVRIFYRCNQCGHEYSVIAKSVRSKNTPCPQAACVAAREAVKAARSKKNFDEMMIHGPPAITGRNPMVGVVDQTADMVMHDYKMTNLQDNVRDGDVIAPKLPGQLQTAADNYFNPSSGATGMSDTQVNRIAQRAMRGAYRGMAVSPTDVFPGKPGEKAIWKMDNAG